MLKRATAVDQVQWHTEFTFLNGRSGSQTSGSIENVMKITIQGSSKKEYNEHINGKHDTQAPQGEYQLNRPPIRDGTICKVHTFHCNSYGLE